VTARAPDSFETFFAGNTVVASVTLDKVDGSSPREAGATMFVSPRDMTGTIGGGQLEHRMMLVARDLLAGSEDLHQVTVPLGPEISQCCGGRVDVSVQRMTPDDIENARAQRRADAAEHPNVFIFGAGHVGRALAEALMLLPVHGVLVDARAEELAKANDTISKNLTAIPEQIVRTAPAASAFVVMTHEHSLDFLITAEALKRTDAAYVGMIGSKTKKASLKSWLRENDGPLDRYDTLVCPIGRAPFSDKRPAVIAALVAAELMTAFAQTAPSQSTVRGTHV
jgi:xanthine dehydrogenase accessory factor